MRLSGAFLTLLVLATSAVAAPLPVRFEPAARKVDWVEVRRAGDPASAAMTVRIAADALTLPAGLPPPLLVEREGFEPVTYTAADIAGRKPVVLRALGRLAGTITRRATKKETFTWLLRRMEASEPLEIDFTAGADQRFSIPLPAAVYQGAIIGDGLASRTIAAIVISPGETTEPKPITLDATAPASFRVIDKTSRKPIAGARVTWDPPSEELNAATSRVLFRNRWSGMTGSDGRVSFPSVGPLPIPLRWRVEAASYTVTETPVTQLRIDGRLPIGDVALRRPSILTVRVSGPRDGELPEGTLVLLTTAADDSLEYRRETSAPLHAGETLFRGVTYGRKRIQVTNKRGETLLYNDFRLESEQASIDVVLEPVEIHGTVTRGGSGVSGIRVEFGDPGHALVKARTNFLGRYEATTWQRGRMVGFAIGDGGAGKSVHGVRAEVMIEPDAREQEVNFELPAGELTIQVVDAVRGQPVASARVDKRIQFRDGSASMGFSDTDAQGKLAMRDLAPATVKLFVKAKGYRTAETEVMVTGEPHPEVRIALQPAQAVSGRVVGSDGMPIAGALVEGGYSNELSSQATYAARTNAQGEFAFDSAPAIGTTFYAMAPGHALAVTTLRAGDGNVIRLERPSNGLVYLTDKDGAPPRKVYRLAAAPAGGVVVPSGALNDLARVNGLSSFQLLGNGRDGTCILPEFLGSGAWDLFITKRGGDPYIYERIGNVITPMRGVKTIRIAE